MRKLYLLLLSLVFGAFLVSGCQTAQTASSESVEATTTTTISTDSTTTTSTTTTSTTSTTTTSTTTTTVFVSINASQSTFIASNFPNSNYSSLVLNEIGNFTVPVAIESGFLYFDTSIIPSSATIISADIKLFVSSVPNNNITVYYFNCVVPLVASTLTWNTRPGAAGTPLTSKLYKISDSGYVAVDITEGVQQWIDGTTYNYGLQLGTMDYLTWNSMTYYSSASPTNKPKLEVVYR